MKIPIDHIKVVYRSIVDRAIKNSLQGGISTYIFVSNDVDALCALKIFTTILKQDEIQFAITPVFSNNHLINELAKLENNQDTIKNLIFLNCGGQVDLSQQWFSKEDNDACAILIDSHRPYNHVNVNDQSQKIFVIQDGCASFEECPTNEDWQIYQQLHNQVSDDDDSDEDEDDDDEEDDDNQDLEDGDDEQRILNAHDREVRDELADLKDDSDGEAVYEPENNAKDIIEKSENDAAEEEKEFAEDPLEEEVEEFNVGVKRPRSSSQDKKLLKMDKRKMKRQKKMLFQHYYRGSFFGKSSSSVLYELGVQLNKETSEMLWHRIVGHTNYIIHNKIDGVQEQHETIECSKEVLRLMPASEVKESDKDTIKQLKAKFQETGEMTDLHDKLQLITHNRAKGSIVAEPEPKLMMLRHWTLYQSLQHSNYMVSKMQLWTEPGQKQLLEFLIRIGCPLEQSKQKYQFMDHVFRNQLKKRILEIAKENKHNNPEKKFSEMSELITQSFQRQFTDKCILSASDMAYSVSTLLEHPKIREFEDDDKENQNDLQANDNSLVNQVHDCLFSNFWVAYDSLDLRSNIELILKGIELFKEMQMAIVRVGTSIIQKKQVKKGMSILYSIIDNEYLKDVELFQQPLALQKLALFVMQVYHDQKPKESKYPFVLSVKNQKKNTNMVVGVMGRSRMDQGTRNDFGAKFRRASQEQHVQYAHDGFDSSMIEIKSDHFQRFIESLAHDDI